MILYNVTVSIDESVHDEWLNWMRTQHIPDVMATGLFLEGRIAKVNCEDDRLSYAISYLCKSKAHYEQYREIFAPKLQLEHSSRYKDKFVAFRTLLDVVETFTL